MSRGINGGHVPLGDHQCDEELVHEVHTLKSQFNENFSYLREIKGMLESLRSKIENHGKIPLEEEEPRQKESIKFYKLGYELRM